MHLFVCVHVCVCDTPPNVFYVLPPPATSDGTRQGLESMRGGVCATQGMKVVLKVGQSEYGHTRSEKHTPTTIFSSECISVDSRQRAGGEEHPGSHSSNEAC